MILTMVAMLSITAAFAEGEKTAEVSNLEAYELNINMNKLSKALGFAAVYGKKDRDAMVKRAISNDVKWMRYILNKYQMRTYLTLLNATMKNRGLIK